MAKSAGKVDVEGLQKKILSFSAEASGGIDALMEEIGEIRREAKVKADEVVAKAEERVKLISEQIQPLNELYRSATGRYYVSAGKGKAKAGGAGGGRQRRSRADLEALAGEVVAFVKGKKDGVSGSDIKAKFGPLLPSVKQWLSQYAPDAKIKTEGAKAQMKYHIG